MLKPKFHRLVCPALAVFISCLMAMPPRAAQAALPSTLATLHFDWVCVTDASLVDAYAPLAAHRQEQGLASLVVSLDNVMLWSPAGNDTIASLRWLAGVAQGQWGAQYLLLGGSHTRLPAPLHRVSVGGMADYDCPIDSYYACLAGDWDMDGDGLYAEWEDDAADPTIHLTVGRVPADDASTVADVVTKILAFESRAPLADRGGLFVSSRMMRNWDPDNPSPSWAITESEALRDTALAYDPALRLGMIFEGADPSDPTVGPLNATALVDSLRLRSHDFVHCQLFGNPEAWELVFPEVVDAQTFDPLVGAGHSFILTMLSGAVGDTRGDGVLGHLLALPDGGAVAAIAPSGLTYAFPQIQINRRLWPRLVATDSGRLGDQFVGALTAFTAEVGFTNSSLASTYWHQSLFGDPATLVRPRGTQLAHTPPTVQQLLVQAVPNPFNPTTEIVFDVSAAPGSRQSVQVEIFDLRGQRIATLFEGFLPPGPHREVWRADAPSGVYFARVTVGGLGRTVKLTLVE